MNRITETEMAAAVKDVLRDAKTGKTRGLTFADLRERVPRRLHLSKADRTKSPTRPGEELWEQVLRNIVSHIEAHPEFVRVPGGLRLKDANAHDFRRAAA